MSFRIRYVFLFFVVVSTVLAMTEKQLKSAVKVVQNVCQPKFKISDETIEQMHAGVWPDDNRDLMCYMDCSLKRVKLLRKDGSYDLEAALKQVPTLPADYQESGRQSVTKCQDAGVSEDNKCKKAYTIAKCIYDYDPKHYVLP